MGTPEQEGVTIESWSIWDNPRDIVNSFITSITSLFSCFECRKPAISCLKEQDVEPDGAWFDVEQV